MLLLDVERAFDSVGTMHFYRKSLSGVVKSLSVIFLMVCHRVPCCLHLFITSSFRMLTLATFADDTALFVPSSDPMAVCDGLQGQLNSLTDYFKIRREPRLSTLPAAPKFWNSS
jgi:hypothetical protein